MGGITHIEEATTFSLENFLVAMDLHAGCNLSKMGKWIAVRKKLNISFTSLSSSYFSSFSIYLLYLLVACLVNLGRISEVLMFIV